MKRVFIVKARDTRIHNAKGNHASRSFYSYEILVFATMLLAIPSFAFSADNKNFDKYVAVSVQPYTNWLYFSGPYLDYTIKPSVFTTFEFSLEYKKFLKLFLDVDINVNDNFVGELIDSKAFTKIAGMLGIKGFAVRAAWGQIEGEAVWKGETVPGQPESAAVSTKYTEVALLYNWPICSLGIMYQNYHIPVELQYAYEDDVAFDYYGLYFGMSSFNYRMNKLKTERENGIGLWLDQNLSGGVALGNISEEAKRRRAFATIMAEDKRMKYGTVFSLSTDSPVALSASWQIIAGVCGAVNVGNIFLGFGAGYDGFAQFYYSFNYGAVLLRHGATVKIYCSF
jgi:hypothetical protein